MDPITLGILATALIPFATAGLKKLFTRNIPERYQHGVNAVIPIVLGILSTGLYAYQQSHDFWASFAMGISSGGVASSARDIDKNLTRIVETAYKLAQKKDA